MQDIDKLQPMQSIARIATQLKEREREWKNQGFPPNQ